MDNQFTALRFCRSRRDGFTMLELTIVLTLAGIITAFAVPSFQSIRKSQAAQNARDTYVWMATRSRTTAIERGTTYLLEIDPVTDRAWLVLRRTAGASLPQDTVQIVDYPSQFGAQVSTVANTRITLCYNPRGYAWGCSGSSPSVNTDVTFSHATASASARVKVLGHIERL